MQLGESAGNQGRLTSEGVLKGDSQCEGLRDIGLNLYRAIHNKIIKIVDFRQKFDVLEDSRPIINCPLRFFRKAEGQVIRFGRALEFFKNDTRPGFAAHFQGFLLDQVISQSRTQGESIENVRHLVLAPVSMGQQVATVIPYQTVVLDECPVIFRRSAFGLYQLSIGHILRAGLAVGQIRPESEFISVPFTLCQDAATEQKAL